MSRQVRRPSQYFQDLFRGPQIVITEHAQVKSLYSKAIIITMEVEEDENRTRFIIFIDGWAIRFFIKAICFDVHKSASFLLYCFIFVNFAGDFIFLQSLYFFN